MSFAVYVALLHVTLGRSTGRDGEGRGTAQILSYLRSIAPFAEIGEKQQPRRRQQEMHATCCINFAVQHEPNLSNESGGKKISDEKLK